MVMPGGGCDHVRRQQIHRLGGPEHGGDQQGGDGSNQQPAGQARVKQSDQGLPRLVGQGRQPQPVPQVQQGQCGVTEDLKGDQNKGWRQYGRPRRLGVDSCPELTPRRAA